MSPSTPTDNVGEACSPLVVGWVDFQSTDGGLESNVHAERTDQWLLKPFIALGGELAFATTMHNGFRSTVVTCAEEVGEP